MGHSCAVHSLESRPPYANNIKNYGVDGFVIVLEEDKVLFFLPVAMHSRRICFSSSILDRNTILLVADSGSIVLSKPH